MTKQSDDMWYIYVQGKWDRAAAKLVDKGWERHDNPTSIIPATFTKDFYDMTGLVQRTVYLARDLGQAEWYIRLLSDTGQAIVDKDSRNANATYRHTYNYEVEED